MEMEIALRYGYAASIGSLMWALTNGASDRGGDGAHLTGSK